MFKASILLVVAIVCWQFVRETEDQGWWQRESEKIEISKKVELYQLRAENIQRYDLELAEIDKLVIGLDEQLNVLKEKKAKLLADTESTRTAFFSFRHQTLGAIRTKATGQVFELLETGTGKVYKDATIVNIDDAGVSIRHEAGSARLTFADLSAKQRQNFGVEQRTASAAQELERDHAVAYDRWINRQMVSISAENLEVKKISDSKVKADVTTAYAPPIKSKTINPRSSRLSEPAKPLGTRARYRVRNSGYYSSNYSCGPVYRVQNSPQSYSLPLPRVAGSSSSGVSGSTCAPPPSATTTAP